MLCLELRLALLRILCWPANHWLIVCEACKVRHALSVYGHLRWMSKVLCQQELRPDLELHELWYTRGCLQLALEDIGRIIVAYHVQACHRDGLLDEPSLSQPPSSSERAEQCPLWLFGAGDDADGSPPAVCNVGISRSSAGRRCLPAR